jgi:superfamily I DNA/RNA helicase
VKLMTPHSSKGLQYRVAVIAGVGYWPYRSAADEAQLLYVAMTRATHELLITSSKSSAFTERLRSLCLPLAA